MSAMHNNQSTHHQPSYNLWTWIVALLLALILLWMLLTGRGPSGACCGLATGTAVLATETIPATPAAINNSFSFSASGNDFSSSGVGTNISWLAQADALKAMLSNDLYAQGDDKNVVLSGTVNNDTIKQQKGADAQAFFGPDVIVDNQLTIKATEQIIVQETVAPAAVKIYFDSAKTALPTDTNLTTIIEWLKTHPASKAVLSGYHDPRGNKATNEKLAKDRAESVEEALEAAGIDDNQIEMRKPQSVDGGVDLAEARRVEVSIQ